MNMRYVVLLLLLLPAACGRKPEATVVVFAASSLKEVVTEVAAEWTKRSGVPTRTQFEASSTLARQIKEGAPAAVFISAAPEWLDLLRIRDRVDWLSNRLVCVVPKDAKDVDLKTLKSLALANEQAPAGQYARAALSHLGIPIPERTIYGSNVRDVLSKVSQGGVEAGIVYATDAAVDPAVRIAFTFPPDSHPRILYSAGLLTPAGKGLYDALREPWVREIAVRHGFMEVP